MILIRFNILVTVFIIMGSTVFSQVELTRDKCREMALEYSKQIKLSKNQKEQALLDKKTAKAGHLPGISATGLYYYKPDALEYTIDGGPLPTYTPDGEGGLQPNLLENPITGETVIGPDGNPVHRMYAMMPDMDLNLGLEGVTMAGVQIEQPVYMGGKIRAANKMAKSGIEIANLNMDLKISEVLTNTDAAYYQYISVKAKKQAAKEYKLLLDSLVVNVQAAMEEGMTTRNDLLKTQVKRNEAILMVQKADNGQKLARMNLCRIIGLPLESDISVDGSTQVEENDLALLTNKTNSPEERAEYKMLNKSIELRQHEAKIAKADLLPQIGVSAGYSYFGGLEINGQGTDDMSFSAMASVKIPIFNWFEGQNKLSKARLATEAKKIELDETEKMLQMEIARAKYNLEDAISRLNLTETALEQARENLETSQEYYNEGMEQLVELLEAQAQWQKAQSEYIDAQTSVKLMKTQLLKATGELGRDKKPQQKVNR